MKKNKIEEQDNLKLTYYKENYCKYDNVKISLAKALENGTPIKEISKSIGVSLPTIYKYKGLLGIENGKHYITPEEEKFLSKRNIQYSTSIHNVSDDTTVAKIVTRKATSNKNDTEKSPDAGNSVPANIPSDNRSTK